MYVKTLSSKESHQLTDLHNIKVAAGGKYARVIVECYVKDGIEHFTVSLAPPVFGEHNKEIKVKEELKLCKGVLDFKNVSKAAKMLCAKEEEQGDK